MPIPSLRPMLRAATALAALSGASPALAGPILLDEVTVSGDALDLTGAVARGASVAVVTREEIAERQYKDLLDVLKDIPAVAVGSGGTRGTFSQLRLRGAEANQTLVLVDGQPVNMVADSDFDLSSILIDAVEKIEVIKGPQSGLYGAGAHAGVIAIATVSGKGLAKPQFNVAVGVGAPRSRQAGMLLAGSNGPMYAAFDAGGYFDGGFNASAYGSELDPSKFARGSLRAGINLGDNVNLEAFVRGSRAGLQSDPTDFVCLAYAIDFSCLTPSPTYGEAIDGDNFGNRREIAYGASATAVMLDGALVNRAVASQFDEAYDFSEDGVETYRSTGQRTRLEYRATYRFPPELLTATASVQVDHEHERFTYVSPYSQPFAADGIERAQTGVAAELAIQLPESLATVTLNARYDAYSAYDGKATWRAAVNRVIFDTRLHASAGTGTTKPTFYEQYGIFGNFVGNPDLKLEHSLGWDFGIEHTWLAGSLTTEVTVFGQTLRDEIATTGYTVPCDAGFCYTLVNLDGRSQRHGIEVAARWQASPAVAVSAGYAFVDSRDPDGVAELRRPRHSASADISYRPPDSPWSAGIALSYTGATADIKSIANFPYVERVRLPGYALVSLRAGYAVDDHLSLNLKVDNLFDAHHQDIYGYPGTGRAIYLGARVRF